MTATRHLLDYNQLYSLTLEYDAASQRLKVTVTDDGAPWPRLQKAFTHQLQVESGGAPCHHTRHGNTITFDHVTRDFVLRLGKEPIGKYTIGANSSLTQTFLRPLTVDETRRMGNFHHVEPYSHHPAGRTPEESDALLAIAKNAVTADFHTHSSGQITPRGLLEVAMKHKPYYYPVALLNDAGIDTSYQHIPAKNRKPIRRIKFPPTEKAGLPDEVEGADLHGLTPQDLAKLEASMTMPTDKQATFTEMEYDGYRFRYPLSKDPILTHDALKKVAQEYAAQGINYALISYVGLDDPKTLKIVLDTMEEIHNDPATRNVQLLFLNGIPRGLTLEQIEDKFEKTKALMDIPYIIGPDVLGLEVTKTKEFVEISDRFTAWQNEHKPGSFQRAHAGENDKHRDNVKDYLKMGEKYPHVHFLVGHGIYGIDAKTRKIARAMHKHVTFEFNPASNIALNNVDDVKKIPFTFAVENDIPFVLGSDSAGMYQTSAIQLGLGAYHAGLDRAGFRKLAEHQQTLRGLQLGYSETVAAITPHWESKEGRTALYNRVVENLAHITEERSAITAQTPSTPKPLDDATIIANLEAKLKEDQVKLIRPGEFVPEFEGKRPVIFVGASGDSWKRLTRGQQRENAIAVDMLIHALGDNCIPASGRFKKTGLAKVVNQALNDANEERKNAGRPLLPNLGIRVDSAQEENEDKQSNKHLTHMLWVKGKELDIADAIANYALSHDSVLVGVSGSAFTRDIILKADQGKKGLPGMRDRSPNNKKMMLLMSDTAGASAEKAAMLHPDYKAVDGKQLIKKLYEQQPDLFDKSFSMRKLNKLYDESSARVATYGYNLVDSTVVSNVTSIDRQKVNPPSRGNTR